MRFMVLKIKWTIIFALACQTSGFFTRPISIRTGMLKVKEPPNNRKIANSEQIILSNSESELFQMLIQCVRDKKLNTTIRIAGGWVRDKLLSSRDEHNDIDIALDNMSGMKFASIFDDWCKFSGKGSLNVAVIKPNPSKSKHLETAHVVLLDKFVVDFVNLRTDQYCAASRIPTVTIGTPSEDAHRRDLTINSLFYNIHSGEVEDFTSLGLMDLNQSLVRTPLSALQTLSDDPLRSLRVVRFACRLNFRIHDDLAMACNNTQVHDNLRLKVSKERIYSELETILRRPSYARAAVLLHSFDYWKYIMPVPPEEDIKHSESKLTRDVLRDDAFHSAGLATLLMAETMLGMGTDRADWALGPGLWDTNDNRKIFALSAMTIAASGCLHSHATDSRKQVPLSQYILNGMKASNKDCAKVARLHAAADLFEPLIQACINHPFSDRSTTKCNPLSYDLLTCVSGGESIGPLSRLQLGLAVRRAGNLYPLALLLAASRVALAMSTTSHSGASLSEMIIALSEKCGVSTHGSFAGQLASLTGTKQTEVSNDQFAVHLAAVLSAVESICSATLELGLQLCYADQPLLSYETVKKMFRRLPRSSIVVEINELQARWQLVHPHGQSDALMAYLQERYPQTTKPDIVKKAPNDEGKSLGVLYTGYLDKRNPVTGSYKKRFVVLTHDSIHWFKRTEGYDLFGEERGQVALGNILTTRVLDEDSTTFEIQGTDTKKRLFRATTPVFCEEWVSAVRSAIKGQQTSTTGKKPVMMRRSSLAGIRNIFEDNTEENPDFEKTEVTVLLVSLASAKNQTEVVVARKPEWDRVITVPRLMKGDHLIISTSNGGTLQLSYDQLMLKSEDGIAFELAVQNVPLASSLKISLMRETNDFANGGAADIANEARKQGRKLTRFDQLLELLISITSERASAINLVLSTMVIMAGGASLRSVGADTTLLFLMAALLSVYNLNQIYQRVKEGGSSKNNKGQTMRVILHGHAFTSPDEPINEPENEIPQRFIDGSDGDLKEARRRWDITRHWREVEGVNTILDEPQPHFQLIKTMYPHYHCGRGKDGHVIFYERPGDFESAQLSARGVKTEQLVRHWLFTTEYQWQVMCGGDETAKGIAVIDINNVKMGDLAGDNMNYLKKTIAFANAHYPERSHVIFIVNAPFFFSLLWKIVKPMVHENTQKKVKILSAKETLKGLQEHIHISQIPVYYGGECDFGGHDSCRFFSPDSVALTEYVKAVNERASGVQNKTPFDVREKTPGDLPPGNPGDVPLNSENSRTIESSESNVANLMGHHDAPPAAGHTLSKTSSFLKRGSVVTPAHGNNNDNASSHHHSGGDDWSVNSATTAGGMQPASALSASPKNSPRNGTATHNGHATAPVSPRSTRLH